MAKASSDGYFPNVKALAISIFKPAPCLTETQEPPHPALKARNKTRMSTIPCVM